MKRITITIETGNAAFEEYGYAGEVARILRRLAKQFDDDDVSTKLKDWNGNTCGHVKIVNARKSKL